MSAQLQTISWQRADTSAVLLVAGDRWLRDGLLDLLPASRETSEESPAAILIVERHCLELVSDEQLALIDAIILVDPTDRERWRATQSRAGRPKARITPLPSLAAETAADHAMLLMLTLTRTLLADYSAVVDGSWTRPSDTARLSGHMLGIVGLGRSGRALAKRALAFGMRVIFHDAANQDEQVARMRINSRRFDQLLREADILSLHVPVTNDTIRMIDAPELAAMKSTSVLINVADGRLVDEGSLVKALRRGDIAGAGLDTYAYEPLPGDSPLIGFDNVVLTPRTAWMSSETEQAAWLRQIGQILTSLG
jgi:phosphoglycerate dehydrogenase-like enzyme